MTPILIQLAFILYNVGMARWQAYRFDVQHKNISHILFGAIYGILCVLVAIFADNLPLAVACLFLRIPVFNSFLNYWRKPRRPLFYLGEKSVLDRAFKGFYPVVWGLSIAVVVVMQIFIYG